MSQYKVQFISFKTYSGKVLVVEDASETQHFCYELNSDFVQSYIQSEINISKSKGNCKYLRRFQELITMEKQQNCFLFEYVEGKLLSQIIFQYGVKEQSISVEIINKYLLQMLDALYTLHNMNILGRVFSVDNILVLQENQIMLMDFGFAPEIYQPDQIIYSPPEVIDILLKKKDQNVENKQKFLQEKYSYGLSVDIWLLGCILYQFIKINPVVKLKYENINDYHTHLNQEQQIVDGHVQVQTSRYDKSKSLLLLIEKMLTLEPNKRILFSELFQEQYIIGIMGSKSEQYRKFYLSYEKSTTMEENCKIREISKDIQFVHFQSDLLQFSKARIEFKNEINTSKQMKEQIGIPLALPQNSNVREDSLSSQQDSQLQKIPVSDSTRQETSELDKKIYLYNYKCCQKSQFIEYWDLINDEQYKCYLLESLALEQEVFLKNYNFQCEVLTKYFLQKMNFIILGELIEQLSKGLGTNSKWADFKKQLEYEYKNMMEIFQNKQNELINEFQKLQLEKFSQLPMIQFNAKETIQKDQQSKFTILSSSELFIEQGYSWVLQNLINFLIIQQNVIKEEDKIKKLYDLIFKALLCRFITKQYQPTLLKILFQNQTGLNFYDIHKKQMSMNKQELIIMIKLIMSECYNNQ